MTLTLEAINAARSIVWLGTGHDKRAALAGLLAADPAIVGSRVRRSRVRIIADRAAVGL
jgi:6-phosphogluconolactonase/glucosamine-6-phosphate isomerase/deaminase